MFDPARALDVAESLAFPRLSGTEGNQRARATLARFLADAGVPHTIRPFPLSRAPALFLSAILVVDCLLLLLCIAYPASPAPPLFLLAFFGFLVTVPGWLSLAVRSGFAASDHTDANILTDPVGQGRDVLFVAHHDSKSQWMPIPVRICAFVCLAACHVVLVCPIVFHVPFQGVPEAALAALVIAVILLTLGNRNDSSGALDNASGVGALAALAEALQRSPIPGIRARCLFTGAEEIGLQGAWHFTDETPSDAQVVNLDTIGAGKRIWIYGARGGGCRQLRAAAESIGQPLLSLPMPVGMLADHVRFVQAGRDAVTLTLLSRQLGAIHTRRDRSDLLDPAAFARVSRLLSAAFA